MNVNPWIFIFLIVILTTALIFSSFAQAQDSLKAVPAGNAEKFYQQGLKLITAGRFDEAEVLLKNSLKEDPKLVKARIALAGLYENTRKFEEALNELKIAEKLEPDSIEIKFSLVSVYYHQSKLDLAKETAEKILQKNSQDKRAYNNLGLIYNALGKQKEAEELYKKAVGLDPNFTGARINLSSLYISQDRLREAKNVILKDKPEEVNAIDNPRLLNNLGIIYFKENNLDFAEEAFKKSKESGNLEAIYNLALVYIKGGQLDKAEGEIYKFTDRFSFFSPAYIVNAEILVKKNSLDEAEVEYQKAQEIGLKDLVFYVKVGNFFVKKGDYQKAIDIYNEAVKIFPKEEILYNNLGVVYFKLKKFDTALFSFLKAVELNKKYADAYFNLGRLYEETKENALACQYYKKYIELYPDAPDKEVVNKKIKILEKEKQDAVLK